jgi:hypothetical protein
MKVRKSDRSADASGAGSLAPFSLPDEAPDNEQVKKNSVCRPILKLTGNGQDNGRRSDQAKELPGLTWKDCRTDILKYQRHSPRMCLFIFGDLDGN